MSAQGPLVITGERKKQYQVKTLSSVDGPLSYYSRIKQHVSTGPTCHQRGKKETISSENTIYSGSLETLPLAVGSCIYGNIAAALMSH